MPPEKLSQYFVHKQRSRRKRSGIERDDTDAVAAVAGGIRKVFYELAACNLRTGIWLKRGTKRPGSQGDYEYCRGRKPARKARWERDHESLRTASQTAELVSRLPCPKCGWKAGDPI